MSFTKARRETIKKYLLEKLADDSSSFIAKTVASFSITKNTAYRYLRELIQDGVVEKHGRSYSLSSEQFLYELPLADIPSQSEDFIYDVYLKPLLAGLPDNVMHMWYYCFTEMMNNVIDHSEASEIRIYIRQDYLNTSVILDDNGIGIFKKIKEFYHFASIDDAIIELFKGKLTTDAANHSGEGIFFTSRIMDIFAAISDGKVFSHSEFREMTKNLSEISSLNTDERYKTGTVIFMKLSNFSKKTNKEIMDQYADLDGGFSRTIIPIKNIFPSFPVSRSQAKRLSHRLDSFQEVQLDFKDVDEIGQGFAHELFVVFQKQHPGIRLIAFNTTNDVQRMIYHVLNS